MTIEQKQRVRWWLWFGAAFFGVLCRVALFSSSTGTNDIRTWKYFAELFDRHGPYQAYRIDTLLNHPPLGCLLAWLSLRVSRLTSISFDYLFKFLPMVADIAVAGVIGLTTGRCTTLNFMRVTAIYLISVGAIEISCFHGNTDALCLFFLVFSAYLCQEHRSYFWGALSLSCAINVKIIPLLVAPLFFLTLPNWRSRSFFIVGLIPGALLLCAGYYVVGDPFVKNIFGHRSYPEPWGLPLIISYYDPRWVEPYRAYGVRVIMTFIALLGAIQWATGRPFDFMKMAALSMLAFLIFAPGFGVQYIIYAAPFFVAAGIIWGLIFSIASGIFTTLDYLTFIRSYWPIETHHFHPFTKSVARAGLFAWSLMILLSLRILMWNWTKKWCGSIIQRFTDKNDTLMPG